MHFGYLRKYPWNPSFSWVETSFEAAHQINSFHEDYPKYAEATNAMLQEVANSGLKSVILNTSLLTIHEFVFDDKPFAGKWREVNVRVGMHLPPESSKVANLMCELELLHRISSVNDLIEWYKDFETIHPFQDGNGRVGGIIVAGYAHNLHLGTGCGWLAVGQ